MRILFPMHSLERGGGCRVVAEAANGLVARGHRVMLALPHGAPIHWPLTAEVVRVPALAAQYLPPADVLIPTFYTTMPPTVATGRPFIRFCLGFEPLWVPDPQTALQTYRHRRPVITISTWLQRVLWERAGRASHLVHLGVDRAAFHPKGNKGLYGSPSVAYLLRGPGYTWKGTDVFLQAMSMIHSRRPDVTFLIVANQEAAAPSLAVPHIILRAPDDREFAAILSAADVFVFSSLYEGFGLPPLEAMACGTAVVATANGGICDYAHHGYNSLLVPPGQAAPLAEAVLALLNDGGLRETIAANGQATASVWTWHRFYDEFNHLVTGLAGARS